MNIVKRFLNVVKTAFFPEFCPYCKRVIPRGEYACEDCKANFPDEPFLTYGVGGYDCIAPFEYKGGFAKAVKTFKFQDCTQFSGALAFAVVQAVVISCKELKFDYVTCVPMHREQKKKRGYNQSELLARDCAELMKIEYIDALEKHRKNKLQHTLNGSERIRNVKGVYRVLPEIKPKINGKSVLLIDDIITSGSTLGECARMLEKAGCERISCAVVCCVR